MLGIIYALGWLFGSIKDSIKEISDDIYGQRNRKIGNDLYSSGTKLINSSTGHQTGIVGNRLYQDYQTGVYYRPSLTSDGIKQEQMNKEYAILNGYSVFRVDNCRLPVNVVGKAYKDIQSDRMYVYRHIQTKLNSGYNHLPITSFLISINKDNYGQVERFINGNEITSEFTKIFNGRLFDVSKDYNEDLYFKWKING